MNAAAEPVVLITGATDGLGKHVAIDLARAGAFVLLHGRNPDKGQATVKEIRRAWRDAALEYHNADFAHLDEVRRLAEEVRTGHDRLDILINNAGIGFGAPHDDREISEDGHELRFQVNHLAGFLLTIRLLPLLRRSAPARIVNVASAGQQPIDFDDLMLHRGYSGVRAYRQSKLAMVIATFELAQRLAGSRVTVNALHPATFMDTNMVREAGIEPRNRIATGAAAAEHLALSPDLDGVSGEYFDGKARARADAQAYDAGARRRLWELSEALTGTAGTG